MPPKRTKKLDVFADNAAAATRSSLRSAKRKQSDADGASLAPTPKRPALGAKTTNSRDTSFRDSSFVDAKSIRHAKKESVLGTEFSDPEVLADVKSVKREKQKSLLKTEFLHSSSTDDSKTAVLRDAFKPGSEIRKHLDCDVSDIEHLASLIDREEIQEAADFIAQKELWAPPLLACFADTAIEKLDLSTPASFSFSLPKFPPSHLLAPLFTQHCFTMLTTLSLRKTIVSSDDIALLRILPSLTTLDLCATGITNMALHHLVCHRYTLTDLNISENEGITDEARFTLRTLHKLTALYLRGTNFSMPALRQLVLGDLPKNCRLFSVPTHAVEVLQRFYERYCVDIPEGYLEDPAKVENLTLPILKRNLELHAKFSEVQVSGNKVELVHRLKALLANRRADKRLLEILGKPKSA